MKKYYVYKTTNTINDKIYIGVHGSEDIENDDYTGSGTAFKEAIEYHGVENFNREILFEFDTMEEALKEEKSIVTKEFIEYETNYNLAVGGQGPPNVNSQTRQKMSESAKKRFQDPEQYDILVENRKKNAVDPVVLKKISEANKKAWKDPEYRKRATEAIRERSKDPEYRKGMSERTKKLWQDPEYREKMSRRDQENKKKSPEHKRKLSEAAKRQWQDPEFRKRFFKGRDPISKTLPCQYCEKPICRSGIRRHEKNCSLNPEAPPKNIPCEYCGDTFHIIGMTSHMKTCKHRPTNHPNYTQTAQNYLSQTAP